jgi:hypothetical protein
LTMGKGIDAFVYNLKRWTYPMDPQTAQSTYYYDSPPTTSSNNYNVSVSIMKGGSPFSSMSMF